MENLMLVALALFVGLKASAQVNVINPENFDKPYEVQLVQAKETKALGLIGYYDASGARRLTVGTIDCGVEAFNSSGHWITTQDLSRRPDVCERVRLSLSKVSSTSPVILRIDRKTLEISIISTVDILSQNEAANNRG